MSPPVVCVREYNNAFAFLANDVTRPFKKRARAVRAIDIDEVEGREMLFVVTPPEIRAASRVVRC